MYTALAIVLAILACALLWYRRMAADAAHPAGAARQGRTIARPGAGHPPTPGKIPASAASSTGVFRAQPYASVTIAPGLSCCKAVMALTDQRFLVDAAPALPLPDCTEAACKCRYRRLTDRRDGDDRRFSTGVFKSFGMDDKRHRRDRRVD